MKIKKENEDETSVAVRKPHPPGEFTLPVHRHENKAVEIALTAAAAALVTFSDLQCAPLLPM